MMPALGSGAGGIPARGGSCLLRHPRTLPVGGEPRPAWLQTATLTPCTTQSIRQACLLDAVRRAGCAIFCLS